MKRKINIDIGDYYASNKPTIISTILGPCVAACLYDPVKRIGGMNHIFLPGKADLNYSNASSRYSINAMELLTNKVIQEGGSRHRLLAKVFGGAHLLQAFTKEDGIGEKISTFVIEFLHAARIRIIGSDLGGKECRKIYFHTDTGAVFLKRLRSTKLANIAIEQSSFRRINASAQKEQNGSQVYTCVS